MGLVHPILKPLLVFGGMLEWMGSGRVFTLLESLNLLGVVGPCCWGRSAPLPPCLAQGVHRPHN